MPDRIGLLNRNHRFLIQRHLLEEYCRGNQIVLFGFKDIMIKKILFENYKPFGGLHEIEIRPLTLLIGKNSSGKSSITHLISLLDCLFRTHDTVHYKQFISSEFISNYSFHNLQHTGLCLGLVNEDEYTIKLGFVRNDGKHFLHSVEVYGKGQGHSRVYSTDEMQEVSNSIDFLEPLLNEWGFHVKDWAYTSNYIGPIRAIPSSVVRYSSSTLSEVNSNGENACDFLIESYKGDQVLMNNISSWLEDNMGEQKLAVSNLLSDIYSIDFDKGNGVSIPIEEVGEGVSQVLPVLVQSFLPTTSEINIIEQPVLHLHPAAHAAVADRLIDSIIKQNKHYVIESHSANFLLALRRAVSNPDNGFTMSDAVIYFIDNESETNIQKIEIAENGELSTWPTGVFGEGYELMKDILRMNK